MQSILSLSLSLSLVLFLLLITPSLSFASCCRDNDGDGYSDHKTCRSGTDCDDRDWFIRPGTLGCNNCKDVDDDGYFAHDLRDCSLGDDLDDADPEANPGKDGGGGNGGGGCSNVVWYKDYDDDKYSADGVLPLTQCDQPPGYKLASDLIQTTGDCADNDHDRNPGEEEVCDGKDNNCDNGGNNDKVDEGCCEGWIDVSPKEVRPQDTGGSIKANVIIGLNKPAPPDGCNVSLVVEPPVSEKDSGGHKHEGGRPKGTLSKDTLLFREGKTDTESPIYYTSFAISGTEKIKAEFKESKKSEKTAETSITVKVDGLQPLSLHEGYYRPTGSTPTHSSNHWGTLNTNSGVYRMATYLYYEYSIIVGINDMSLFWGGLFDICGTWNRKDTCSNAPEGGHLSHRKGTSADVDRIVQGGQYAGLGMARWTIDRACFRGGGKLADEPTYHCEFK